MHPAGDNVRAALPLTEPVLACIVAPFAGSFLAVLIRRLPAGRPVTMSRSACEACGHTLAARDLVPLLSYAWLRGHCRFCAAPIAAAHVAVELACLAIAVLAVAVDGGDPALMWADCMLGWTLLTLGWIDWTHLRLPDVLTLPLLLGGLAVATALDPDALLDRVAAAVAGYAAFRLIAALYRWRRGRDGLGEGDAKLMAAAGAWVGLSSLSDVMLGAALLGLALAAVQRLRGREIGADTALPFGTCLAAATWLVWLVARP